MARSDVQLMLDVKAGDEQSFALLLHRYRSPLVNFLYRMVRNREQAEDLAQEVFIRVYRAREEYVPSAKFTTWLFRIATNLALNSVRDTRHQRMELSLDAPITTDAEDGDEKTLDVADKHPDIEQHLVEEARKQMIKHAIDKLPEKQRAAVLLHKYQELDYNEIAKIHGMFGERVEIVVVPGVRDAARGVGAVGCGCEVVKRVGGGEFRRLAEDQK